jgi:PAS domain S-box-containing protein
MHALAFDAIASALNEESAPLDAVAGLLVTLRPVSDAAVIEDTDAQHAARALAITIAEPEPGPEPEADPELESLRAQLEQLQAERDALRAELQALPDKAAFDAARRDRDEARTALAAALAERDRAAGALAHAAEERDAAEAALCQAEAGHQQQAQELRRRLEDAERTAALRAAEVETATRAAAEQRERVAAGHLETEALARERAGVSQLEARIASLAAREADSAIPRGRPYEPGLDDADFPRAYIGLDGRFSALNDSFCRLVGYSEAEFSGAHWPPVIDSRQRATLRRATARLIAGDLPAAGVDTVYMSGTGDLVRVVGTLRLERDEAGSPRRLVLDAEPLSVVTA